MKFNHLIILALVNCCTVASLYAQSSIVGSGSSYNDIFPSSSPVTYDVPGGGLLSITLSNGSTTETRGLWDLTAQGGANATILASLTESAAQVTLTGSSLQFGVSNDNNSLLGLLGTGASIHYAWDAVAYFDTPGSVLNYTPNTQYSVSFDVDGSNGLLSSVSGLNPSFTFELVDGSGNPLTSSNNTTQINIAGLLGTGVPTGTISLTYTTDSSAPTGPIGVRFIGDAQVGSTALSLGTTYATISNLDITSSPVPVPEPGGCLLIASVGVVMLLRRRRLS